MISGFYMDAHVPAAISRGLRERGIAVLTAQEAGGARFTDPRNLDRATDLNHLVFGMDEDCLVEAARRLRCGIPFSTVVFARAREVSIEKCIHDLELIARLATPEDHRGYIVYLPL